MTGKDKIKQISKILFGSEEEQEVFVDVTTADGRIMRVNDIAIDQPVEWVEGENLVEVEDGTYELEDGNSIVVMGGIITEIIEGEAEAEEEVVEEEMEATETEAEVEMEEEVVEEEAEFDAESVLQGIKELLNDKFEAQEKKIEELESKMEAFGKAPSIEKTKTKQDFSELKANKLRRALGK